MERALFHFSQKPVSQVHDAVQAPEPDDKPRGLWFSVGDGEDGWREWCEAESFGLNRLKHRHIIYLAGRAKVCSLSSAAEIDDFHDRYVKAADYEKKSTWRWPPRYIDWQAVASDYDAILIAPYIWDRRLDGRARWYYGWDCASGCVWRKDAVSDVVLMP